MHTYCCSYGAAIELEYCLFLDIPICSRNIEESRLLDNCSFLYVSLKEICWNFCFLPSAASSKWRSSNIERVTRKTRWKILTKIFSPKTVSSSNNWISGLNDTKMIKFQTYPWLQASLTGVCVDIVVQMFGSVVKAVVLRSGRLHSYLVSLRDRLSLLQYWDQCSNTTSN